MTEPSRRTWPQPAVLDDTEPTTGAVRTPMRLLDKLLLVAVVALLLAVGTLTFFVYQQQLYIEGRGEYRDRESARIAAEATERLRRGICDLLDTFPEGLPSLERAREKYDCGPGLPLAELTPDEQARLQASRNPPPPRDDPAEQADRTRERQPPTVTGGASPDDVPQPAPEPVPPRTGPGPDQPPPPTGAVTETVCSAIGVCLPKENP